MPAQSQNAKKLHGMQLDMLTHNYAILLQSYTMFQLPTALSTSHTFMIVGLAQELSHLVSKFAITNDCHSSFKIRVEM